MRLAAAATFLGARASDPANPPDPGLADALSSPWEDVESVVSAWEDWRRDRLGAGR